MKIKYRNNLVLRDSLENDGVLVVFIQIPMNHLVKCKCIVFVPIKFLCMPTQDIEECAFLLAGEEIVVIIKFSIVFIFLSSKTFLNAFKI